MTFPFASFLRIFWMRTTATSETQTAKDDEVWPI